MTRHITLWKRTALYDQVLGWELPAKELRVGHFVDSARKALTIDVALDGQLNGGASHLGRTVVHARENTARYGGGDGSQDWDEGENPHGGKKCGGEGKERNGEKKIKRKAERRRKERSGEKKGKRSGKKKGKREVERNAGETDHHNQVRKSSSS